jgi:hypothetical protein
MGSSRPWADGGERRAIAARAEELFLEVLAVVHPSSTLATDVDLRVGVVI